MWLVMALKTELEVEVSGGWRVPLELQDETGLVGMCPVFKTKKAAQKYAALKNIEILEIATKD